MTEPRQTTSEEIQDLFIGHLWAQIHYWAQEERARTVKEKLSGLVFTLLGTLDGASPDMPAFYLIPTGHHANPDYCRERARRGSQDEG